MPLPAGPNWAARLLGALLVVAAVVVLALVGAAFLPRWWAHRVGDVSDGRFSTGIMAGLVCGAVFTMLPLLVLRGVLRRRRSWSTRFALVGTAIVLAAPNLLTLGIVLGSGRAAHAGQRTMDVEAPGFRGATLIGAVLGVALIAVVWAQLVGRRRTRRRLAELREELDSVRGERPQSAPER